MRHATKPVSKPLGQLELREPNSARVLALMREREKLLVKIARKKLSLDAQVASIKEMQIHLARAQDGMRPLMEQGQKVEQDIHQLFATLLAKGKLTRKERRLVREVYDELQIGGVISPAPDTVDDDVDDIFGCAGDEEEFCSCGADHPSPGSADRAPSAKRPASKGASTLRDVFRRLANAIHPDRSQTDADRDHRTEAMKEVTIAYQNGDLARLLELENAWLAEEKMPVEAHDETERRCANLERTNSELKKQLRDLEKEIRELKGSVPVLAADELGLRGKGSAARVGALVDELQASVDSLCQVRDFVRSFVDGKITLDEFTKGPAGAGEDDADMDLDPAELDAFLADIFLGGDRSSRRGRGRRPSRR